MHQIRLTNYGRRHYKKIWSQFDNVEHFNVERHQNRSSRPSVRGDCVTVFCCMFKAKWSVLAFFREERWVRLNCTTRYAHRDPVNIESQMSAEFGTEFGSGVRD